MGVAPSTDSQHSAAPIAREDEGTDARLLGITLQGARQFAARHWRDQVEPPAVPRGALFPAKRLNLLALIRDLKDAGHTNDWLGGCPVLRVLETGGQGQRQRRRRQGQQQQQPQQPPPSTTLQQQEYGAWHRAWCERVVAALGADDADVLETAVREAGRGQVDATVRRVELGAPPAGRRRPPPLVFGAAGPDELHDSRASNWEGVPMTAPGSCGLARHDEGDTALHLAAQNGKTRCCGRLLLLGAARDRHNKIGKTPLDCCSRGAAASEEGCAECAAILREAPAEGEQHAAAEAAAVAVAAQEKQRQLATAGGNRTATMLPLLRDLVRRDMNGYNNCTAVQRAGQEGMSWCEALRRAGSPHVGQAHVFVCWALESRACALADALQLWLDAHPERDPARTFFWVSAFSAPQGVRAAADGDEDDKLGLVRHAVRAIRQTLLFLDPCDDPIALSRSWVLWELFQTADCGASFDVVVEPGSRQEYEDALQESLDGFLSVVARVDFAASASHEPRDKDRIALLLDAAHATHGFDAKVAALLQERMAMSAWSLLEARAPAERAASAQLVTSIGEVLCSIGKEGMAEALFAEAVERCRGAFGSSHENTLASLDRLGLHLAQQGRLDDALPLLEEALAARLSELGDGHIDTLSTASNLGDVLLKKGKKAIADGRGKTAEHALHRARDLFQTAAAGTSLALGSAHEETITAFGYLAEVLMTLGELGAAEVLYRQTLEGLRAAKGDGHPDSLLVLNALADAVKKQGRLADALALYEEALEGCCEAFGELDEFTVSCLHKIGALLKEEGRYAQALDRFEEALVGYTALFGAAHPKTLSTMHELGDLSARQGDLDQAFLHFEGALAGRRWALGDVNGATLLSMERLADVHCAQGEESEGLSLHLEVLAGRRVVCGTKHPLTTSSVNRIANIAVALKAKGMVAEALPAFEKVLANRRAALGTHHPTTQGSIYNLAVMLRDHGRANESLPYFREELACCRELHGDSHEATRASRDKFIALLVQEGHSREAQKLKASFGARRQRCSCCGAAAQPPPEVTITPGTDSDYEDFDFDRAS